jgi:hypothetical protein
VNGSITSATTVNGGSLFGSGTVGAVSVTSGFLVPKIVLNSGSITLSGAAARFSPEINMNNGGAPSAPLLNVTGTVALGGGTLSVSVLFVPDPALITSETFLLLANDGTDAITGGPFSSITFSGLSGLNYTTSVNYAFHGTDSLGRVGDGNDLAVTITGTAALPEPASFALLGGAGVLALRRKARGRLRCEARCRF